jgi:hypothetical protein
MLHLVLPASRYFTPFPSSSSSFFYRSKPLSPNNLGAVMNDGRLFMMVVCVCVLQVDRRIQRILGDAPHMEHAGSDVALTISSGCLRISTLEGSTVVACHDMPNISFASGGDPVSLFVCFFFF